MCSCGSHDLVLLLGPVTHLVVEVDESTLHLGELLEPLLQRLADVVALPQRHLLGQHDVDLDEEVVAEVEGAHRVDEQDLRVVVQAHPRDLAQEVRLGCVPRQHLYLFCFQMIKLNT